MLKHLVQIMTYSDHAGVVESPHLEMHYNPPDNVTDKPYMQQGMHPSHPHGFLTVTKLRD